MSLVCFSRKKKRKEIKQWITAFIAQEITVVYKPQRLRIFKHKKIFAVILKCFSSNFLRDS